MMKELEKPIEVIKYSEKKDNRDTFLIQKPPQMAQEQKEDKITMNANALELLGVKPSTPTNKLNSRPSVAKLREYERKPLNNQPVRLSMQKNSSPVQRKPIRTRALQPFEKV